jgi:integrase
MKGKISKSPSYLVRGPYIFYFRMNVPRDLQPYIGKKELRYSLKTGYLSEARQKARYLAGQVQYLFRFLRKGGALLSKLTDAKIQEMVQEYLEYNKKSIEGWYEDPEESPFEDRQHYYEHLIMLDEMIKDDVEFLALGNYKSVEGLVHQKLLDHDIHDIEKGSKEHIKLCRSMLQASIKGSEYEKLFLQNELPKEPSLPKESQGVPIPAPPKEKSSPTLKEAIDEYKKRQLELNKWKPNTVRNYQPKINAMIQVFGDRPVNQITKNDARKLAKLLEFLPPGFARKKEYKDISDLNPKDLKGKHDRTMDVTTRRGYLIFARQVLSFAEENEWVIKNPVISGIIPGKKENPREQRLPFEDPQDLARIFNPEMFLEWSKDHPSRFWIPLLALYTGCRLEEIASLYCEDVFEHEGLWCIDINDNYDRTIKNKNAIRSVPLHPFLVEQLKFPQYVAKIKAQGSDRVFTDLKKENHKYGNVLSKRFNYYLRKKAGIIDKKKTFHSFRHNVTNHLMNKPGMEHMESMVEELSGRAGKTETRRTYFKGYRSDVLYKKCISKLKYEVDLSHLKQSKYVVK